MKAPAKRKKEGFQGQKAIVIPRKVLNQLCIANDIINKLYITDIGYYPKAKFHYRERPSGADQHILIYCQEGSGKVKIGAAKYEIRGGDFFMIPIRTAHTYSADEANPWTIYWVHFKGSISSSIVSLMEKQARSPKGSIKFTERTTSLFDKIYGEMERGYDIDHLIYANMCFGEFLTTFIYNEKYNLKGKPQTRTRVDIAIDFLSKHFDQTLTLEDIAASVNLSPAHFSVIFKKKTGFSPIEYLNHLKVQKACQYLLFTDLRIREIALELGIGDPYYFSRMFTKVMGMSPNEYREVKKIH